MSSLSLKDFLEAVGAKDLLPAVRDIPPRAFMPNAHGVPSRTSPQREAFDLVRLSMLSSDNRSVALNRQNGGYSVMYGLGDPNFTGISVIFDEHNNAQSIQLSNSNIGYSGHRNFRAEPDVLNAIIKAANSTKSGAEGCRGLYLGQLAKAAGALTPNGNSDWGINKVKEWARIDTSTREGAANAASALTTKWAQHEIFSRAPAFPLLPAAPKAQSPWNTPDLS